MEARKGKKMVTNFQTRFVILFNKSKRKKQTGWSRKIPVIGMAMKATSSVKVGQIVRVKAMTFLRKNSDSYTNKYLIP